jgi:hypothetical protein
MTDTSLQFATQKYTHLPDFLDKEVCQRLTQGLKELIEQKATEPDPQCPKSEAIYGAPIFDTLLLQLLPRFEQATGLNLFPTYSYARWYVPGEELLNHVDRASCETSATITLGFDGDNWPIYMGDGVNKANPVKISMDVGDAVLYRGTEKHHWREIYTEGKWQAQVFLHYVDANGPHRNWIYDGRYGLNLLPQEE